VKFAGVAYMARPKGGVNAAGVTYEGKPLISVVMTCFNTGAFVEEAVESILAQTWKNIELIAVDDCSADDTRERLNRLAERDSRVKVFCFGENRGTYWCKNFGLTQASGEVLTFMDSDDTSHPERLEAQFEALNVLGRVVSTCNHVRKDINGNTIAINGVVERVAYISQMIKRPVLEEIGYFDTVRTSADDEFLRRIRITYGREAEVNVKRPLYVALLREGSLTSDPDNAINFVQDRNAGQAFLSPQRRHYAACCSRWHQYLDEKGLRPYVPFPVVRRPFPAYGKLVVAGGKYAHNHVSACLASYPPRAEKLQTVVSSLLPQIDHLYVYLNEYEEVPAFLKHSRITVELGRNKGELRDNGKFYFMDRIRDGYVFTVDDDIDYPADYVQKLIQKLEFYDRKAIVGLHGTIYAKPVRSFFKGRTLLHFEEALSRDTIVNQLGTGTVAFHTELLRPAFEWFKDPGMADVWFAVETKKLNITQISVQRDALWAKPLGVEDTTLFREFRQNDSVQTTAIRSVTPWKEILRAPLNGIMQERSRRYGAAYRRLLPRAGQEPSGLVKR
jgi:glycosyltransferase involved in cell wall biosynthesis